jgi:hypothetical protein
MEPQDTDPLTRFFEKANRACRERGRRHQSSNFRFAELGPTQHCAPPFCLIAEARQDMPDTEELSSLRRQLLPVALVLILGAIIVATILLVGD